MTGVFVAVGVRVGVEVIVGVGVLVATPIGVLVGVGVKVAVGVTVGVLVGVAVGPLGPSSSSKLSKFVSQPFVLPSVKLEHTADQLVTSVPRWFGFSVIWAVV